MVGLKIIEKAKTKKDDLADTVVQIEAVFSYMGLYTTYESNNLSGMPKFMTNQQSATQLYNTKNSVGYTLDNMVKDVKLKPFNVGNVSIPINSINIPQNNAINNAINNNFKINMGLINNNSKSILDESKPDPFNIKYESKSDLFNQGFKINTNLFNK